ncbi:hypothetical protein NSP_19200 [Nodularia spumigena CCY9414]|nr:hypothetical protein NSP_19200 [Nodularia spumigena CCY9414]
MPENAVSLWHSLWLFCDVFMNYELPSIYQLLIVPFWF